jgi:S1-C subfamily serine protease
MISSKILGILGVAFGVLAGATPASAIVAGQPGGPLTNASLMILSEGGGLCSGIVIATDTVLTAGHCAPRGKQLRIHYRDASGEPVLLEVKRIATHPQYRAGAIKERQRSIDLALIQSAQPLRGFASATLSATPAPSAGEPVFVSGFGIRTEGDSRSTGQHYSARLSVITPYGPSSILLWSADPKGLGRVAGAGACLGDSGGALSSPDGTVIAITSWATSGAQAKCGLLTQGILVAPQRRWIDQVLGTWDRSVSWLERP